jgi:hypothetical protein
MVLRRRTHHTVKVDARNHPPTLIECSQRPRDMSRPPIPLAYAETSKGTALEAAQFADADRNGMSRNTGEKTKAPEPYRMSVEEFSIWQNQILRGAERYWPPQLTARPERRH